MSTSKRILVIGALGQVGRELVETLRQQHGQDQVVATDIKGESPWDGPFENLDVLDLESLADLIQRYNIGQVYQLAALLSATAEQKMAAGWRLNMDGLFNILNLAKEGHIDRVFWPSSIAVFGPTTPQDGTPQDTIMDPNTVYGISKLAGERWCEYYHHKFGVDVRSVRYPGLIGYKSLPGGGTTDYAVDIFHEALKTGHYTCFLNSETRLPMMYMPDAIRATISIMEAAPEDVKIRSSYNIAAMSFSPAEIADEIRQHIPSFTMDYSVDERQKIADGWPSKIDDSPARQDWGWQEDYSLSEMTKDMIFNLRKQ